MITSDGSPREFSVPFNPALLSRGDGVCSGGDSDLDDRSSELVIAGAGFRQSVRTGCSTGPHRMVGESPIPLVE